MVEDPEVAAKEAFNLRGASLRLEVEIRQSSNRLEVPQVLEVAVSYPDVSLLVKS